MGNGTMVTVTSLRELRRALCGYIDEEIDAEGNLVRTQKVMPRVESAAWYEHIERFAASIPNTNNVAKILAHLSSRGIYPPAGETLVKKIVRYKDKKGRWRWRKEMQSCQLRGKQPCAICKVPTSVTYQNVLNVCADCQLAGYEMTISDDNVLRVRKEINRLGLTNGQLDLAMMFCQGFKIREMAQMNRVSESSIHQSLKRIRRKLDRLGLKPLTGDVRKRNRGKLGITKRPRVFAQSDRLTYMSRNDVRAVF